eukprot:1546176-Pleurochrysis_carterae.AAC.4
MSESVLEAFTQQSRHFPELEPQARQASAPSVDSPRSFSKLRLAPAGLHALQRERGVRRLRQTRLRRARHVRRQGLALITSSSYCATGQSPQEHLEGGGGSAEVV